VSERAAHLLGRAGERLAAEHFARLGFDVLDRNHRTRAGELDLVVRRGGLVVFVEVKTRRANGYDPFEAITPLKQRRLRRLAAAWLAAAPKTSRGRLVRFDAVAVIIDRAGRLLSLEHREDVL
jgi:putative endonuclease